MYHHTHLLSKEVRFNPQTSGTLVWWGWWAPNYGKGLDGRVSSPSSVLVSEIEVKLLGLVAGPCSCVFVCVRARAHTGGGGSVVSCSSG